MTFEAARQRQIDLYRAMTGEQRLKIALSCLEWATKRVTWMAYKQFQELRRNSCNEWVVFGKSFRGDYVHAVKAWIWALWMRNTVQNLL